MPPKKKPAAKKSNQKTKKVNQKVKKAKSEIDNESEQQQSPVLKTKKKILKKPNPPPQQKKQRKKTEEGSVPKAYAAYTPEQYKQYSEVIKEWKEKSNDAIKEQLSKNSQSKTGNKYDLVVKLADGKVLGSIPRCPHCFGGRPKFNQSTGKYACPGYRDDLEFKNCHKSFTLAELPRTPWID